MNCILFPSPVAPENQVLNQPLCDGNNHHTGALPMSGKSITQIWDKTKFITFIRSRFPQSPDYHLAALTGIPASTCRKHIYGETKPSADHVLQYLALFGPSLICAVMGETAPVWIARWQHEEKRQELELQAAKLAERLAEYSVG